MATIEDILSYQYDAGLFDDVEPDFTKGLAQRAIEVGFEALSIHQKRVLQPYLSRECSGCTNPGGHHNDCTTALDGDELLEAFAEGDDVECPQCENCRQEAGDYAAHWARVEAE